MHVGYCKTCLPTKTVVAWGDRAHAMLALLHTDHDPPPNSSIGGTDANDNPIDTTPAVVSKSFELTDAEWDRVKDADNVAQAIVDGFVDRFV